MTSYLYANFDVPFALAATLTYMDKVYDMKVAKNDFKKFIRKFNRKFPNATWIAIYEYHEDSSIHIHLVFKNARGATHEVLTQMWGHGLAYGIGCALAARYRGQSYQTYVLKGDGESQEGSIWASALVAGNQHLNNLTVIIDRTISKD